ncbi:MAG TPA: RNA methyltransferase [Hyphomicrobium sp.]|nr:RNA methyltransferase [Hyphomicrobium sp.]
MKQSQPIGERPREPKAITSLTNDRVKAIRALEMRKVRKQTGLFVAEGASLLVTARDNGFVPRTLVYQAGTADGGVSKGLVTWALKEGAEVLEVSAQVLSKLASKDNPQTMLGVFSQSFADAPKAGDLDEGQTWLALEEVRDPGNLGTIIRTCDAVGVAGILLIGNCCDPYSLESIRATMGSIFCVPLVRTNVASFMALAAEWPGDVVATDLKAAEDFRAVRYRGPQLVVMGSEGPGLSEGLARAATRRVKIPMAGRLDSLNLAIATALTLYQIRGAHLKL